MTTADQLVRKVDQYYFKLSLVHEVIVERKVLNGMKVSGIDFSGGIVCRIDPLPLEMAESYQVELLNGILRVIGKEWPEIGQES